MPEPVGLISGLHDVAVMAESFQAAQHVVGGRVTTTGLSPEGALIQRQILLSCISYSISELAPRLFSLNVSVGAWGGHQDWSPSRMCPNSED